MISACDSNTAGTGHKRKTASPFISYSTSSNGGSMSNFQLAPTDKPWKRSTGGEGVKAGSSSGRLSLLCSNSMEEGVAEDGHFGTGGAADGAEGAGTSPTCSMFSGGSMSACALHAASTSNGISQLDMDVKEEAQGKNLIDNAVNEIHM